MKMYMNHKSLKLVGKSWQVRAKLKELSRSKLTVQQFLQYSKSNTTNKNKQHVQIVKP